MTRPSSSDDQRPSDTTAATGDQWVIGHGHQRAIVTEVGATLRSFMVGDRPVVAGFGPDRWSTAGRGQVLAPWPNRLGDGRYSFDGTEAQAALDEPSRGNAIHGLVRWMPWRMMSRAQNRVAMGCELHPSPAYPFALRLTIEYRLGRDGLTVSTEAENVGMVDLPFGLGFHPYLTVGTTSVDLVRLRVPASQRLITDDRGLPTGRAPVTGTEFDFRQARLLGVTKLDTGFSGLERDADGRSCVELDDPDGARGITVWADDRFGYFMVYTGDTLDIDERRTAVAVEPMSCPPDAFRSGIDLIVLQPGGAWTGSWGITPR
ncbi:MAG TPA: aldose 1-epimerase family protein [Acidimicrobiales bacterium]|jgi:aldose 1-epimerase|nr:aldose 1-epimerase family protein [Acidimicrobiales bacterium]